MAVKRIRALVCQRISKTMEEGVASLSVDTQWEFDDTCGEDEVRVGVRAVGLNFFDLLMLVGKYQYKPPVPFVPCTEGSGVVLAVGSKVTAFSIGDKVIFTSTIAGAAAEEVVVAQDLCYHIPAGLTFEQAAGFHVGAMTGYHGLVQRGHIRNGETLLVTGATGGMGMAAIQLGLVLGARVLAAGSNDAKLKVIQNTFGTDRVTTINYATHNLRDEVKRITSGQMADVIYDVVGGDVFDACVRCVNPAGGARLLVIGFASGRIPKMPANLALIKGMSLVGVRAGAQTRINPSLAVEMNRDITRWAKEGKMSPYIHMSCDVEDAAKAFNELIGRTVVGKVVLRVGGGGGGGGKL